MAMKWERSREKRKKSRLIQLNGLEFHLISATYLYSNRAVKPRPLGRGYKV